MTMLRPRTWRFGRVRVHTCVLWPECWRERKNGFSFHILKWWLAPNPTPGGES